MCLQIYIYLYNTIHCHLLTSVQLTIQLPADSCPTVNTSPHPQQPNHLCAINTATRTQGDAQVFCTHLDAPLAHLPTSLESSVSSSTLWENQTVIENFHLGNSHLLSLHNLNFISSPVQWGLRAGGGGTKNVCRYNKILPPKMMAEQQINLLVSSIKTATLLVNTI